MIYNEDIAHIELECECGHAILQLAVDKMEQEGYWTIFELNFYAYQEPFWFNLKTNLKLIWSIIRGKRFYLYGVTIPKERMEEFKKFVASL